MANNKKQSAVTDEQIIAALISSGTIAKAAEAAGISSRTIYERMTHREFKAAYRAAKSDLIRQAVFNMDNKLTDAINTIAEIMNDKTANPAIRLQAAQTILNNAQKFAERLQGEEHSIAQATEKPLFDIEF
jgi:fructose-bisphosphate aldolase class 1